MTAQDKSWALISFSSGEGGMNGGFIGGAARGGKTEKISKGFHQRRSAKGKSRFGGGGKKRTQSKSRLS